MKKILLFSFLSYFMILGAYAQSIELTHKSIGHINNGDTITIFSEATNTTLVAYMDVINVTGNAMDIRAKKTELSIIPGSENYFCWVSCYLPGTYVSPDYITLNGNDTTKLFSGDYEATGNAGSSYIRYTFYDDTNSSDSVSFVAHYLAGSGVGIKGSKPNVEVSNIYPNPAKDKINISYDLKTATTARLEIRNILGSVVESIEITQTSGILSINVSELKNGVYFYSFIADEVVISSKKLVIQR